MRNSQSTIIKNTQQCRSHAKEGKEMDSKLSVTEIETQTNIFYSLFGKNLPQEVALPMSIF